jgi:hypothetical protein
MPVRTPFNSGMTFPTALAAPVEEGMRLATAALHYSCSITYKAREDGEENQT